MLLHILEKLSNWHICILPPSFKAFNDVIALSRDINHWFGYLTLFILHLFLQWWSSRVLSFWQFIELFHWFLEYSKLFNPLRNWEYISFHNFHNKSTTPRVNINQISISRCIDYFMLVLLSDSGNRPAVRVWTLTTVLFSWWVVKKPNPVPSGGPNQDRYQSNVWYSRVLLDTFVSNSGSAFRIFSSLSNLDIVLLIVKYCIWCVTVLFWCIGHRYNRFKQRHTR